MMETKKFKAAAVNMDCELGNVKANLKKMEAFCKEAAANGALAICFPELATTGYSPVMKAFQGCLNIWINAGLRDDGHIGPNRSPDRVPISSARSRRRRGCIL